MIERNRVHSVALYSLYKYYSNQRLMYTYIPVLLCRILEFFLPLWEEREREREIQITFFNCEWSSVPILITFHAVNVFFLKCRVTPFYWHTKTFCPVHLYCMASVDDNIEITRQREHVDQRIAFLVVGISFVFFRILNFLIAKLVEPPPSASRDPRRWRNVFVSWTHAILSGCLDISWYVWLWMVINILCIINFFNQN